MSGGTSSNVAGVSVNGCSCRLGMFTNIVACMLYLGCLTSSFLQRTLFVRVAKDIPVGVRLGMVLYTVITRGVLFLLRVAVVLTTGRIDWVRSDVMQRMISTSTNGLLLNLTELSRFLDVQQDTLREVLQPKLKSATDGRELFA